MGPNHKKTANSKQLIPAIAAPSGTKTLGAPAGKASNKQIKPEIAPPSGKRGR